MGLNLNKDYSILNYITLICRGLLLYLPYQISRLYWRPLNKPNSKITLGINPLSVITVLCTYSVYLYLLDITGNMSNTNIALFLIFIASILPVKALSDIFRCLAYHIENTSTVSNNTSKINYLNSNDFNFLVNFFEKRFF